MDSNPSKRFPLHEAYSFAAANGLTEQVAAIRAMDIEWDRSYNSTVRRGYLIRELERRGLLPTIIAQVWPAGSTPRGEAELRSCLRVASEYDDFVEGRAPVESVEELAEARALEFALESHLRDFLAKNLGHVEPGLQLYEKEGRAWSIRWRTGELTYLRSINSKSTSSSS